MKINSDQDDIMANQLVNAAKNLKDQQIHMQNVVLNTWELLCPFIKTEMISKKYQLLLELLEYKYVNKIGRRNDAEDVKLNLSKFLIMEPIMIDGKNQEVDKYLFVKNIDTYISEILSCSRQNINSILRRGNSYKIRELDYVALQYIERMYRQ